MSVLVIFLVFVVTLTIAAQFLLRERRRPPILPDDNGHANARRIRRPSADYQRRG